ncbi:hypothetical protein Ahu01nite_011840 [Winogradskya humida]|uniref:Immunity protein 35 domain-containing protein n=2 Tax=Winogradskya humida TaxID=113566 RepID=A0ABQ3ZIM9_9ACTN|nr:hypothetical protein Ahu01nite_011840 [Actinoplanes humidus]
MGRPPAEQFLPARPAPVMIPRERAVELAEAALPVSDPLLVVAAVEEHPLGWLISWQTPAFLRTGSIYDMAVGMGPYLVDGDDGSVHQIPVAELNGWEGRYLREIKGVPDPDPLRDDVATIVHRDGTLPAMRHLRRECPALTVTQAKAYVTAVRDTGDHPPELAVLTRPEPERSRLGFTTLTGPA